MAKVKNGVHTPKMESTVNILRKQLSDITNTGVPRAPSLTDASELAVSTALSKRDAAQFLKEIGLLKELLAVKESTIESQSLEMKRLWMNNCRASQRNRQLIRTNSELSKKLATKQEKWYQSLGHFSRFLGSSCELFLQISLMLLEHDYKQMYAMFKAKIADLEVSGKNIGEQESQSKHIFSRDDTNSSPGKSGTPMCISSINHTVGRSRKANGTDDFLNRDEPSSEENPNDKRTCLRKRSGKISYKEPTLKKKLRQNNQCEFSPTQTECESSCYATSSNGMGNLRKICEDEILEIMDMPESDIMIQDSPTSGESQDPSTSTESCQSLDNSFLSSMIISGFRSKAARVKLDPSELEEREGHLPSSSCLGVALEATEPSMNSLTGRPIRKAAGIVVSYKETPINIKMRRPA